jgi:DNA transposition AAA+ family ATPase
MNATAETIPASGAKPGWEPPSERPANLATPDLMDWENTTSTVCQVAAQQGLSKSEVARRADIPMGTFSPWYDGKYNGNIAAVTARVKKWIDAAEERVRVAREVREPGFVMTRTASEVIDTLIYAQALPEMCVITLGAGMGKTKTAQHFCETRPHAYLATMRPTTKRIYGMLVEISTALNIPFEYHTPRVDRAIGERLKRNGKQTLLIVDEAQNLEDDAVNQLRYYMDEYGCGIALLGNEELYGRWGSSTAKPAYAQLHSRMGKRLKRLQPLQADIDALVAAWNIEDKEVAAFARALGRKPGALRQVTKTLTLAHMIAAGANQPLCIEHMRTAWINRGGEDLRAVA